MIQIYSPGNENYDKNGDIVLLSTECTISAMVLSQWKMVLTHSIDKEGRWKYIEESAVIKAPFKPYGDQLYRITTVEKNDEFITAEADPIFFDSMGDHVLLDVRPTNKTGQEALDIILDGSKYTGRSDITKVSTAYYYLMNTMECLCGNTDRSFINRWGGEPIYNNFEIIINERCGGDYGVELLYGKNIPSGGITQEIDVSGVVTRIIPKAFNGHLLEGNEPWVDSPLINSYPTIKTKVIEYAHVKLKEDAEGETEGDIICDTIEELRAELVRQANAEYEAGIDKPKVSIECEMVLLQNTEEYKDFKILETVGLGDTIHLKHNTLGIVTDARVVALEYDCLTESVKSVEIGDIKSNYLTQVATTINSIGQVISSEGTLVAEKLQGFINAAQAQLRLQNTIAQRQDVRAIMYEDLDPNSPTYGALSIGTQGWQIANERTPDGRDWVWKTAATANGIIADTITAGTINGITIRGSEIIGGRLINILPSENIGIEIVNGAVDILRGDGELAGKLTGVTYDSGEMGALLVGASGEDAPTGIGALTSNNRAYPMIAYNSSRNQSSIGTLQVANEQEKYVASFIAQGTNKCAYIGGQGSDGEYKTIVKVDPVNEEVTISPGALKLGGAIAPYFDGAFSPAWSGTVNVDGARLRFVKGLLVSVS